MAENIMQAVQLLVDSETAKIIENNGAAEIVLRRKDQKFNNFFKARILQNGTDSEAARQIMNAATTNGGLDTKLAASLHKTVTGMNLANKKLDAVDSAVKIVSRNMESVMRLSKKVAGLSYIQMALSAANMAVDIAGFSIIANKMKGLSEQLNHIAAELGKVKDISVEDMRENCEALFLDYNSIVTKINDGDALDRDNLESYLKRAKTFLSKLNRLLRNNTVDVETLLNMIFTLLPAYTSVLCIFLRAYYSEKQTTPLNYDNFLEVFQEINDSQFQEAVQDYYLLEKGYDYRDVIDILNVQLATIFSERLEIEDQLELIETFCTAEEYFKFEKALDAAVKREISERAEEIAGKCGVHADECRKILCTTSC